jgi:hypothetical protein
MKPIIVVVGATGGQGGSVVKSFLTDGKYFVRGITRNIESPKAMALKDRGVEMVVADLNDIDSLIGAFTDATAIYAVTDYFEPFVKTNNPSTALSVELTQGKNLAKAASLTPSLKHYIWSTLPNAKKNSNGKWVIPHFEGKNMIDEYIRKELKELWGKTTFLWNAFYASNLLFPVFKPSFLKTAGKHIWLQPCSPSTPITCIGDQTRNIGPFVLSIVSQPKLTLPGKFVFAYTETMTEKEMLEKWTKVTGKEAIHVQVSLEDYDTLFPGWGKEMGMMMCLWDEAGEKSWSGEDGLLTGKDLGVDMGKLVGVEKTWEGIDWDA